MDRNAAMTACYSIPGMLWPSEQGWLYDTLRHSRSHCEIGVHCGRSLFATCAGFANPCDVLAIDAFTESGEIGRQWVQSVLSATIHEIRERTQAKVELAVGLSTDIARDNAREFDSVWIDACHHYAECRADIEAWTRFVKPGGIICGHDYWARDPGVMDAVNETGPFEVISGTRIWWRRI